MNAKKINTLNDLRKRAAKQEAEGFIVLSGGIVSSKAIRWTNRSWQVLHQIDGTINRGLSDEKLAELTNIPNAIAKGAFYIVQK